MSWLWHPLIVGCGGFFGAMLRYGLSGVVQRLVPFASFPFGTLSVNVAGSLLIGVVAGLVEFRQVLGPDARLFLMIGLLGGFTTFSSFAYETLALGQEGLEGLSALVRPVPVARRHTVPAQPDLSDLSRRAKLSGLGIDDRHFLISPGAATAHQPTSPPNGAHGSSLLQSSRFKGFDGRRFVQRIADGAPSLSVTATSSARSCTASSSTQSDTRPMRSASSPVSVSHVSR